MSSGLQLMIPAVLILGLVACQDSDRDEVQTTSDSALSTAARFNEEMGKAGCELLTPELVGATLNVPAEALRQMKIMGCRYSWKDDTETLEAGISMLRVYKSEAAAAQWFANATKSRTAEEMKAEMEEISRQLDQSKGLENNAQKSSAKSILASVGSKAVVFEDVADVDDEARVNDEGTVFVRVDNLTFTVTAYKGAKSPPIDMSGVDIQQMAKVSQEHAARWTAETAPQRKSAAILLTRAIVAGM